MSITSSLGSVLKRVRGSHGPSGLEAAEHPQCGLEKSNCFTQMVKHFLQRLFLATRLILILKTEETSKGNTCEYMQVLLEQAWAHEYQFIAIQYKYCTISMQATIIVHPVPPLLPLQPHGLSLPSDSGLHDTPG